MTKKCASKTVHSSSSFKCEGYFDSLSSVVTTMNTLSIEHLEPMHLTNGIHTRAHTQIINAYNVFRNVVRTSIASSFIFNQNQMLRLWHTHYIGTNRKKSQHFAYFSTVECTLLIKSHVIWIPLLSLMNK